MASLSSQDKFKVTELMTQLIFILKGPTHPKFLVFGLYEEQQ